MKISKFITFAIIICVFIFTTNCTLNKKPEFGNNPDNVFNNNDFSSDEIYDMLFDINNHIEILIDISEDELSKIQKDYERFSSVSSKSPIYRVCNIYLNINEYKFFIEEVGIRMKGNTSRRNFYSEETGIYDYIHYKLKFSETFDDEEEYTISERKVWENENLRKERKNRTFAGLEGLELKWNKNIDGTHLRTYLAYDLFEKNNYLAPNATIGKVMINNLGEVENLGVFDINEPVDEIFLAKHLNKEQLGGDLYKVGWGFGKGGSLLLDTIDYIGIEDELSNYFPIYDLKTNKKTSDFSCLKNIIKKLNTDNPNLEELFDMDYFLRFAALSYMTGNPDDYRNNYNNYYLYILNDTKQAIFIPYDLDRTYGITKDWDPYGEGTSKLNPFSSRQVNGMQENILILKTISRQADPYYQNIYLNYLVDFSTNNYFSIGYVKESYDIVKSNYKNEVIPSIYSLISKSIEFNLTDNNYNIEDFITNIKENIQEKR